MNLLPPQPPSMSEYSKWLTQLKAKIRNSQLKAALKVNAELLSLYWELGEAITAKQAESEWGDKIITQLSKDLLAEFPEIKGFSRSNLFNIRKWYQFYKVQHLVGQSNQLLDPSSERTCDWRALKGEA